MANETKKLIERRQRAWEAAKEINDKSEGRELSSEEQHSWDKAWDEVRECDKLLRDAKLAEFGEVKLDEEPKGEPRNTHPTDAVEYRSAFRKYLDGASRLSDAELRVLQVSESNKGGYLVPQETVLNQIISKLDSALVFRQLATTMMVTNAVSLGVPTLDTDADDAEWTTEFGEATYDEAIRFGKRNLQPWDLRKRTKISRSLVRMSGNVEEFVLGRLRVAVARTQEKAFLTGSGANRALGVFTASAQGISTGRDVVGGTTTAPTFDALIDVKYGLQAEYRPRAAWIMHGNTVKLIAKIKDGEGQYIWQPSKTAGEPDQLLGHRIVESAYAPNTYSTGLYFSVFGDLSYYWIVDSLAMSMQRLDEKYAEVNQYAYLLDTATDGMPVLEDAFVRAKFA